MKKIGLFDPIFLPNFMLFLDENSTYFLSNIISFLFFPM